MLMALYIFAALQTDLSAGKGSTTEGWRPPYDESRVPALLRERCESNWPSDFTMQEACLRAQVDGAAALKEIDRVHGSRFNKQVETCVDQWTKEGTPDFSMIATCARMQIESYFRLNGPQKL